MLKSEKLGQSKIEKWLSQYTSTITELRSIITETSIFVKTPKVQFIVKTLLRTMTLQAAQLIFDLSALEKLEHKLVLL